MADHKLIILGMYLVMRWSIRTVDSEKGGSIDKYKGPTKGMCDGLAWGFSILTLILFILIIIIMVKYCQAREYRKENGLYLQLSMTDMRETMHLGGCLMAMDQLYQEDTRAPLIRDIQVVNSWLGPVAVVEWGRRVYATQISGTGLDSAMAIPTRIIISGRMARRLEAIPVGDVYVRLLRYNEEVATVLPRGKPMMTSSGWSQLGKREPEMFYHKPLKRNKEKSAGEGRTTQIALVKKDRANKPESMALVDLKEVERNRRDDDEIYAELR